MRNIIIFFNSNKSCIFGFERRIVKHAEMCFSYIDTTWRVRHLSQNWITSLNFFFHTQCDSLKRVVYWEHLAWDHRWRNQLDSFFTCHQQAFAQHVPFHLLTVWCLLYSESNSARDDLPLSTIAGFRKEKEKEIRHSRISQISRNLRP